MLTRYFDEIVRQYPAMDRAWQQGLAVLDPTDAQLEHGLWLHRESLVIDNFGFLPMVWTPACVEELNALGQSDIGGREFHFRQTRIRQTAAAKEAQGAGGAEYRAALQASGLSGMVQTVGAATVAGMSWLEADIAALSGFTYQCHRFRDRIFQAGSAGEFHEAKQNGKLGVLFSANSPPLPHRMIDRDDELQRIEVWYRLGFRFCHLTYNRRNTVGEGGVENPEQDGGLSQFGREVVGEFNRVGLIVDVAHSSRRTVLDAARLTNKPMMSTHAGCRTLFDHHRNKTDEELRVIAATDGVCGIVSLPSFLGDGANIHTLLNHIMHAVKVVGVPHVAIGTDTAAPTTPPTNFAPRANYRFSTHWAGGWNTDAAGKTDDAGKQSLAWTNWPLFTVGLVMRGVSDDDIRQILGLNLLRVLHANAGS